MDPINEIENVEQAEFERVEQEHELRRVFRLRLPESETLTATIHGVDHVVVEVSELAIVLDTSEVAHRDGVCRGVIHWDSEHSSTFSGTVAGIVDGGYLIRNVSGITMRDMVQQQRRLIIRYPAVR